MLQLLLYPLVEFFTPFNIFQYITFRSAYAGITSLLISFYVGPLLIAYLRRKKFGESIREDGPEHHHNKKGTPTMGGVLIIGATLLSVFLWQNFSSVYTYVCVFAMLGFGGIGFYDDYIKMFRKEKNGLSPRIKLILQCAISICIVLFILYQNVDYATFLYLPMFKHSIADLQWFYVPFAIFLLVGTSNAVNLSDGLDGLAVGLSIIALVTFGFLAYLSGRVDFSQYLSVPFLPEAAELSVFVTALTGSCIGFLWYNCNPAEIFMGDTGSLALGGLIGTLALLLKKELLLIIIGGVFVMEVVSVMIQVFMFRYTGKRIFLMTPIHHHFELKGWCESKVVLRFWILGCLFSVLSLSTLKIQ